MEEETVLHSAPSSFFAAASGLIIATTSGSGSSTPSSSSSDEQGDDNNIVIYTGHLDPAFCVTFALIFLCLAVVQVLRGVIIRAKGKSVRQFMTRLLLCFTVLSALVRSVFFATMPARFEMSIYYLLWWIPEFLNIAACFLYIRLWLRTYASARHVGEVFTFRRVRRWLSRVQYTAIVGLLVGQLGIWLAMLGTGREHFPLIQKVDVIYLCFWEAATVLTAFVAFLSVHVVVFRRRRSYRRQLQRQQAEDKQQLMMDGEGEAMMMEGDGGSMSEDLPFPANISRVDVVLLFWLAARNWRLVDTIVCAKIGDKLSTMSAYWTYIGPFYFCSEFTPGALLIFSKVLEMLDHGMVQYRKIQKANATGSGSNTKTNSNSSGNDIFSLFRSNSHNKNTPWRGESIADETTALLSSVSVDPVVKNWIIRYDDLEMIEFLGGGAGGEVWKAVYQDSVVAVKKLKKGLVDSPRDLADFCSEMKILSSLRHENVVSFYGACINPPHICIISEYLQRKNLRSVLLDQRLELSLPLRMGMMIDMCKALRFVHSNRIIHRDLKPENLMIGAHFNLKVGDFGSGTISPFASDSKKSGYALSIAGSNMYMAPEVYQRKYSFPADVYSAGVIFWEVYTRSHIYEYGLGIDEIVVERKRPHIPKDCPPVLSDVISRAWDHDPKSRPTFTEILKQLKAWQAVGFRQDFASKLPAPDDAAFETEDSASERETRYRMPSPPPRGSLNLDMEEETEEDEENERRRSSPPPKGKEKKVSFMV
ncbi:Protein kinase domain-containing protein [Balamuthia mandrillaris]